LENANHIILIGAALVAASVIVSAFASRAGTPLLLVFLILGMLAGEDGPGGIQFHDVRLTYLIGSVALGIILENVTLFLFGKEPRNYPSLLADNPLFEVGDITVSPLQVIIPAVGLLAAVALHLVARGTRVGKSLLAVAQNPDAARLMGIDVSRAISIAFAISTIFAGIGGILIAPLFNVSSDMGTLFGIKAFAVAIVGGITSASGVVLAGLLYGIVEALVAALLGSTYTQIITFAFVIAALALLPNGLLGQAGVKKV